jgi:hypothetical protein
VTQKINKNTKNNIKLPPCPTSSASFQIQKAVVSGVILKLTRASTRGQNIQIGTTRPFGFFMSIPRKGEASAGHDYIINK